MASQGDPVTQESVVLASFENRHAAERMLASLGREFRKKARKGAVTAFVISASKDGSLKVTQSRVLTAGGIFAALIGFCLALWVGLLGFFSFLRGARSAGHAVRARQAHVGSDEQRTHEILAQAGPNAAVALVRCKDPETGQTVAGRAAERAIASWDGSRTKLLSDLDPGKHARVRTALGEPSTRG